jgi:hypothetical protein
VRYRKKFEFSELVNMDSRGRGFLITCGATGAFGKLEILL